MDSEAAAEAEPPKPATARPTRNFLIIAITLLLLKLLLVSRREMVPERMDAEGYASVSLDVWASIFGRAADHPPGASLAMASAHSLGIPYRIFTEIFLAAAAFLFFRPLVASMRLGIAAAAISYGLLLFHPTLILGMDRAVSDPVAFLCWLFGAGGIIGFVAAPQDRPPWWSLGLAIASFAFAGITRSGEGAIVFVEMAAIALLSIFLFRSAERWRRRRAIVACLCAVVANFAATQALSAVHFVNAGYWGAAAVESREWQQLYSAALAATGENPEVFGYLPIGRILYTVLAALFWPSLLAAFLCVAAIVMRSRSIAAKSSLIAFAISVTTIDVLCRISFYSMVDWILWEIPPQYILGASVLTVVTVSMLLAAWLPPVVGHMLGPKLTRFPGLWFWSKNDEYPGSTAHEKL